MFFFVSLDQFIFLLLAFVVLGLVSSVPSQAIGWEEHLLFCVEWDVKPLTQSINQSISELENTHESLNHHEV